VVNDHKEILSLKHPEILALQKKMVEKIMTELNAFDNLYFEICNEPYFGDVNALNAWQKEMAGFIEGVQKKLPVKQLISQNVENGSKKIIDPYPVISIFNFHYAKPPVTVEMNYALNKPIGDNETGFNGIEDVHYRTEAWDFLVAGGALYNNLDYSFTAENEDGSFVVQPGQPGGGGTALRTQLQLLKNVMDELNFIAMKPSNSIIKSFSGSTATIRALADEGKEYLLYVKNTSSTKSYYSLRYQGFLTVPVTGEYWLSTVSDDGVRLWIDNKLIINNWTDHGSVTDSVLIDLNAGSKLPLKLEYYQGGGGAVLSLDWKAPGNAKTPIPLSALTAIDGKTPGVTVERFSDIELKTKTGDLVVTKVDPIGVATIDSGPKNEAFELSLELPAGDYLCEWIEPVTGKRISFPINLQSKELANLTTPLFFEDLALIIKKK
jgi:hypothetical protein